MGPIEPQLIHERIKVVAAATAYGDAQGLQNLAQALALQTHKPEFLHVVDNSPSALDTPMCCEIKLIVDHKPENIGLGGALEVFLKRAELAGATHLWLFDQDSIPAPDALEQNLRLLEKTKLVHNQPVGIVASLPVHPDLKKPAHGLNFRNGRFVRVRDANETSPYPCDVVITAGMLIDLNLCRQVAVPVEFFLDLVDYEYCLRVRDLGLAVVVNPQSKLVHRMGEPIKLKFMGCEIMAKNYSGLRWYYFFRNRAVMGIRRANIFFAIKNSLSRILALKIPLRDAILTGSADRFILALLGVCHGVSGKLGKYR